MYNTYLTDEFTQRILLLNDTDVPAQAQYMYILLRRYLMHFNKEGPKI